MFIGNKLYYTHIYICLYKHYLPLTRLLSSLVLSRGAHMLDVAFHSKRGEWGCEPLLARDRHSTGAMAGVGLRTQPSYLAGWVMNSDLSALLMSWLHWAAWPAFLLEAFAWGSLRSSQLNKAPASVWRPRSSSCLNCLNDAYKCSCLSRAQAGWDLPTAHRVPAILQPQPPRCYNCACTLYSAWNGFLVQASAHQSPLRLRVAPNPATPTLGLLSGSGSGSFLDRQLPSMKSPYT